MAGIDKSWMKNKNRLSSEYINGVAEFIQFASKNTEVDGYITCPCVKCNNACFKTKDEVSADLIVNGIIEQYTCWVAHGESVEFINSNTSDDVSDDVNDIVDDIHGMIRDGLGFPNRFVATPDDMDETYDSDDLSSEFSKFCKLMKDAKEPHHDGSGGFSKLSFTMSLLQLKGFHGLSNNCFNNLITLLSKAFKCCHLPESFYEARKYITDLGLDYVKIDVCKNHCMLFWKDQKNVDICLKCGASRWKFTSFDDIIKDKSPRKNRKKFKLAKKIPAKTLWHFPLIPRLKRLYMCYQTASEMRWHKEERKDDGKLRHPADAEEWKRFDVNYLMFSSDSRNVRLGLASDGFNPFGNMSNSYSIWPVILIPYNLPPWLCMNQDYFILSILIPGKKSPTYKIDVYLQPLIEELKELWDVGVKTYYAVSKKYFDMHAALLWTINDFPAYGYLSGWSTQGKLACPCCHKDTWSLRLKYGGKFCYMGHRIFLPLDHRWRRDERAFDGKKETRPPPQEISGEDALIQLNEIFMSILGKRKKRSRIEKPTHAWKKKSIFFELPYWKTLHLRHNLDVLHIEKNICDSLIGTIMDVDEKTKDNSKARKDLKAMQIRKELLPRYVNGKLEVPVACFTLSEEEKKILCDFLKEIKFPDGLCSSMSKCVNVSERKISGMKSHDFHVFLQKVLPFATRGLLEKPISEALTELSIFFKELCSKVLSVEDLHRLEKHITVTLCKIEQIFVPSFFDVMMHLPIHLAKQAILGGPVQYRWMYPIERYLQTLKSYVRNKNRPEGSIAEMYITNECLVFSSRYMKENEISSHKPRYNDIRETTMSSQLSIFKQIGKPLSAGTINSLSVTEWLQVHKYILENCDVILPFIREHKQLIQELGVDNINAVHEKFFFEWLESRVFQLHKEGKVDDEILSLVHGPDKEASFYTGLDINGFRFQNQYRDQRLTTQNSGVVVKVETENEPFFYYGVLDEILELTYTGGRRVHIFRCEWWNMHDAQRGFVQDNYGCISVNMKRKLKTNEPFVLASQVEQCFYVNDLSRKNWGFAINASPRDFYNMGHENEGDEVVLETESAFQEHESNTNMTSSFPLDAFEICNWKRLDVVKSLSTEAAKKHGWLDKDGNHSWESTT